MNYSLNQPRNDYFQPQIFSNSPHNKTDTIALHFIIIITIIIIIQELFDMTEIHSIQTRDIHLALTFNCFLLLIFAIFCFYKTQFISSPSY